PAGYLISQHDGLYGYHGNYYDYVLGGNGLFIEARSDLLSVCLPIAAVPVRGLKDIEPRVELAHGLIPNHLWQLGLNLLLANAHQETFLAFTWEGEYRLRLPDQEQSNMNVKYSTLPNTVLDLHSHTIKAFFSGTDDRDEQGFRLFAVCGNLTGRTEVRIRVGVYGYFNMLRWDQVFQGQLSGAVEAPEEGCEI
ncbi:MAG: hypothetical protein Q8O55_01210, partial [Dehalococcoidales bacterium]|nr:hypothetical protein [Dehalococcoidales bacterium]